jgi:hypothetical protein
VNVAAIRRVWSGELETLTSQGQKASRVADDLDAVAAGPDDDVLVAIATGIQTSVIAVGRDIYRHDWHVPTIRTRRGPLAPRDLPLAPWKPLRGLQVYCVSGGGLRDCQAVT